MFCDECHLRPVVMKFQVASHGQTIERSLCQVCGQKYSGMLNVPLNLGAQGPFALLSGMLTPAPAQGAALPGPARCDRCGYTFHQFQHTSMLGCPECYEAFSSQMEIILRRSQGGTVQHAGKFPSRCGGRREARRKVESLSRALEQAVQEQRFEEAARLRDEIRALREEMADES
jgi:protein arginine kinase activator